MNNSIELLLQAIISYLFNLSIDFLNFKVSKTVISVEIIESYTNDTWISF
jgi:hypothetical protein